MANLERDEIEAGLLRKGFAEAPGDHKYFKLYVDGKYTGIQTKVSRGKKYKTLGDDLISVMARQLKLTKGQFLDLIRCPLSRDAYLALLEQAGQL